MDDVLVVVMRLCVYAPFAIRRTEHARGGDAPLSLGAPDLVERDAQVRRAGARR